MTRILVRAPMAKRKAKTASARFDEELLRKANVVAAIRNMSTPDYLDLITRPLIESDYKMEFEKEAKKSGGKRGEE